MAIHVSAGQRENISVNFWNTCKMFLLAAGDYLPHRDWIHLSSEINAYDRLLHLSF